MKTSTFVLLHGAWHDSSCWSLLAPPLREKGHSVLTPDLPGHGASALPPARATLKAYTQAITALIEGLSDPVVLVGHSMAGIVITEVASRLPHKISQLVYLCAYLPQPGDSVFSLIARNRGHEPLVPIELAMEMSADKRTCTVNSDDVISLFYADMADEVARSAKERFTLQGTLPLAAQTHYDPQALASVRATYICCTRDKVIPLHHQRRMLANANEMQILELDSGHSPFHACPDRLASVLDSL